MRYQAGHAFEKWQFREFAYGASKPGFSKGITSQAGGKKCVKQSSATRKPTVIVAVHDGALIV